MKSLFISIFVLTLTYSFESRANGIKLFPAFTSCEVTLQRNKDEKATYGFNGDAAYSHGDLNRQQEECNEKFTHDVVNNYYWYGGDPVDSLCRDIGAKKDERLSLSIPLRVTALESPLDFYHFDGKKSDKTNIKCDAYILSELGPYELENQTQTISLNIDDEFQRLFIYDKGKDPGAILTATSNGKTVSTATTRGSLSFSEKPSQVEIEATGGKVKFEIKVYGWRK